MSHYMTYKDFLNKYIYKSALGPVNKYNIINIYPHLCIAILYRVPEVSSPLLL